MQPAVSYCSANISQHSQITNTIAIIKCLRGVSCNVSSFICLSIGAVVIADRFLYYHVTAYVLTKATSGLMLFIIFGGLSILDYNIDKPS